MNLKQLVIRLTLAAAILAAFAIFLAYEIGLPKSPVIITVKEFTPDLTIVNRAWHEEGTSWLESHPIDQRFPQGGPDNLYLTSHFEPVVERYLSNEWKITFKLPPDVQKQVEERNKQILASSVTPTPSPK